MRGCELCGSPARVYCESDRASLCWSCDFKVHGANFLVARHSRNVLCRCCQSPTPWSAAGARLGPTVSICVACSTAGFVLSSDDRGSSRHHCGDEIDLHASSFEIDSMDDDEDDDEDDDDEEEEEEESDGEVDEGGNQVVPESSSSTGEVEFGGSISRCVRRFSSDLRYQGNMSVSTMRRDNNHPAVD